MKEGDQKTGRGGGGVGGGATSRMTHRGGGGDVATKVYHRHLLHHIVLVRGPAVDHAVPVEPTFMVAAVFLGPGDLQPVGCEQNRREADS